MNRTVRTNLPTTPQVNPDAEVMQKDQETKARFKAYADLKRRTKPHSLNVGDHALIKQRPQNKASPRFEPVPYTIQDVKGSMITAKRATDQKLVTRNSSFFKKLPNPPEEVIQESSPVPWMDLQAPLDFDGPETTEHAEMSANQEEFNQATPSEISTVKDNSPPNTVDQPVPSSPARFSRSGRQIRKPDWTKDYVMD